MAFSAVQGDIQAATASIETIKIVPSTHDPATDITISSVLYGTNAAGPIPVTLNSDGKSFNLTILPKLNRLQVTLFSPDAVDGSAAAQQSAGGVTTTLEREIDFVGGLAVWVRDVNGI